MGIDKKIHEELSLPYFSLHYESNKRILKMNNPTLYEDYEVILEEIAAMEQVIAVPLPTFTYSIIGEKENVHVALGTDNVRTAAYSNFTSFISSTRKELKSNPSNILFVYSFERTSLGFIRVRSIIKKVDVPWEHIRIV